MRKRYPIAEETHSVTFCKTAPFPRHIAKKACIRDGLAFEADVQIWLGKNLPEGAVHYPSKWISYKIRDRLCHAQPDSFVIFNDTLFVFEMKLRHTPRSAKQLAGYGELLSQLYPDLKIKLVEIYKYWDWVDYPADVTPLEEDKIFEGWDGTTIGLLNIRGL